MTSPDPNRFELVFFADGEVTKGTDTQEEDQ